MKLSLEIEGIPDPVSVEIDSRDRRAFERFGYKDLGAPSLSPLKDLIAANPETYVCWLAWHALVRRGKRAEFGTWIEFESRLLGSPVAEEDDEESVEDLLDDPMMPAI